MREPLYKRVNFRNTRWSGPDGTVYVIVDVREPGHRLNNDHNCWVQLVREGTNPLDRDWRPLQSVTRSFDRIAA